MDPAGLLLAHEALCFEGKASSVLAEAGNADSSGKPPTPRPLREAETGNEGPEFSRSIGVAKTKLFSRQ